ncbi:nitroreductase family protein [Clostridium estertheticum]|uniref:Nitroreductase family protein n=1 Tax=Clostridium estertheticum TaxID=238834 RepID=A0AA47EJR6_9CLOT|nr:nitroreductase family protein [Clostridium estertheticum]MBU3153712.1 nitroreductase family protein [Clostridium estertheticum]WAG61502.1 nitroreductase family protein [Clostridium estertheticum]
MELIKVNQLKCIKCGICTKVCPPKILGMNENGPIAIKPQGCIACGQCVAVCPTSAIDNIKSPLNKQTTLKKFPVINQETAKQFLRSRRSIRCYKDMIVQREQLIELVNIARFAPTASNQQGISYIIVEDKNILKKATEIVIEWMESQGENPLHWSFPYHIRAYRETGIDQILRDAPNLILALAPKEIKNGRENTIFSFAYLELFATTLGLGSCWAGLFEMCAFANYYPLLELFNIPKNKVLTGAVMVGYPQYVYKRLVDRNPLDVTWI